MTTSVAVLSLFAASIVSSVFPVVNAEALVVGSMLLVPLGSGVLIAGVVSLGQVVGKCALYYCGDRLHATASLAASERVRTLAARLQGRRVLLTWTLSASALIGVPPLYVMSVVAGIAQVPMGTFLPALLVGRFVRFYGLVLLSDLV